MVDSQAWGSRRGEKKGDWGREEELEQAVRKEEGALDEKRMERQLVDADILAILSELINEELDEEDRLDEEERLLRDEERNRNEQEEEEEIRRKAEKKKRQRKKDARKRVNKEKEVKRQEDRRASREEFEVRSESSDDVRRLQEERSRPREERRREEEEVSPERTGSSLGPLRGGPRANVQQTRQGRQNNFETRCRQSF